MRRIAALVTLLVLPALSGCASPQAQFDADWRRQTQLIDAAASGSRLPVRRGPDFARSVRALVGERWGDYLSPQQALGDAVTEAFDGWPGEDVVLSDGAVLVSSCSRRDCRVRAALILDRTGAMRAAGLLHFGCLDTTSLHIPDHDVSCQTDPSLTLVLPADAPAAWREALETWANPPVEVFPAAT